MRWWAKQVEIARALVKHRRVFVKASHSIGKSHLAGGLVNWFFDCFQPGLVLTTAPTKAQVVDVLWKEVRIQRAGRPGLQPRAPRMETEADHFAVGYTASSGDAFQGRHAENVFIMFDECTGIGAPFWDSAEGMMTGANALWLCVCNPTDTATRAYEECLNGEKWHVIEVSALEHPNIAAGLRGEPTPYLGAVSLPNVETWLKAWCQRIDVKDRGAGDIEFPPGSGIWYRPGPLAEGRMLGRWPTTGSTSVWSEALWAACQVWTPLPEARLEIGCDVARFGDDFTSFVVRRGPCALHHETHNGWSTTQTAGRLKQLAKEFSRPGEEPHQVPIKVDDDGVGGGVVDQAGGWSFHPVHSGGTPLDEEGYPNVRSELWFATAERADKGRIDLSRLSEESKKLLRTQLMQPTWKVDSQGRRVVEPKADTKKRLKRSPDDADALNLAFYSAGDWQEALQAIQQTPSTSRVDQTAYDEDGPPEGAMNAKSLW